MLKRSQLLTVLVMFILIGFSGYVKADVIRIVVKEEKASCMGVAPMSCYQVKFAGSTDWENFHGPITGFHYVPGYRYEILVNRIKRKNVPADASSYSYKLKKIVKKTRVPKKHTAWNYVLKNKWSLIQMNGAEQPQSPVYIKFDPVNKTINGFAGCNTFFGGYEQNQNTISFKQLGSTMIGCSDETINKVEQDLLRLLGGQTFQFDVAEQTFNLYVNDRLVLMFGLNNNAGNSQPEEGK